MHIKTYSIQNIPEDVYQWCLRNNFNRNRNKSDSEFYGNGLMRELLIRAMFTGKEKYGQIKDLKIYIAHKDGKRMGWAMAYKDYFHYRGKKMFQSFVLPRYRRRGIGTKLLEKATKNHGALGVYSHKGSSKFFESNGLTEGGRITGKRIQKKKIKL